MNLGKGRFSPVLLAAALLMAGNAAGCGLLIPRPSSTYRSPEGPLVTAQWSSRVSPFDDSAVAGKMSFTSLYCAQTTSSQFKWLRFWPNGQICTWSRSDGHNSLAASDGERFEQARGGRYRIIGDQITLELVVRAEGDTYFVHYSGQVNPGGTLTLTGENTGIAARTPLPAHQYRPIEVGPMRGDPKW